MKTKTCLQGKHCIYTFIPVLPHCCFFLFFSNFFSPSLPSPLFFFLTTVHLLPHSSFADLLVPFPLTLARDWQREADIYIEHESIRNTTGYHLSWLCCLFLTHLLQIISKFHIPQKLFFCPHSVGGFWVNVHTEYTTCVVLMDFVVM